MYTYENTCVGGNCVADDFEFTLDTTNTPLTEPCDEQDGDCHNVLTFEINQNAECEFYHEEDTMKKKPEEEKVEEKPEAMCPFQLIPKAAMLSADNKFGFHVDGEITTEFMVCKTLQKNYKK